MTTFEEEKFEEKYIHYFEELEEAYSSAYQSMHGEYNSTVLKAIDRQILNESEPVYEGNGEFRIELPENPTSRIDTVPVSEAEFEEILETFLENIESELQRVFEFE